MKINSDFYIDNIKVNSKNVSIIFLYGTNIGLVNLLYEKTLEIFEIDTNDPFNVSKIDGKEFKDNQSILYDNINTLSMFSKKRCILLDLMHVSLTKIIENNILEAIQESNSDNLLIIKCGSLKQSSFLKYFQNSKNSILVPCFEEKINTIHSEMSRLFSKHKLNFNNEFIRNLSQRFSSDSLVNKMEIEKLDVFLSNNENISEEVLLMLVSTNNNLNLNKVIEYCSNGNISNALTYFENFYENQNTTITLLRMFVSHFKLIEKVLLLAQNNNDLTNIVENLRPPIFFKQKKFIILQCKLWNLKLINLILKRLIELEQKCKLNHFSEKFLMAQFILSTSVLAKNRIKT